MVGVLKQVLKSCPKSNSNPSRFIITSSVKKQPEDVVTSTVYVPDVVTFKLLFVSPAIIFPFISHTKVGLSDNGGSVRETTPPHCSMSSPKSTSALINSIRISSSLIQPPARTISTLYVPVSVTSKVGLVSPEITEPSTLQVYEMASAIVASKVRISP